MQLASELFALAHCSSGMMDILPALKNEMPLGLKLKSTVDYLSPASAVLFTSFHCSGSDGLPRQISTGLCHSFPEFPLAWDTC